MPRCAQATVDLPQESWERQTGHSAPGAGIAQGIQSLETEKKREEGRKCSTVFFVFYYLYLHVMLTTIQGGTLNHVPNLSYRLGRWWWCWNTGNRDTTSFSIESATCSRCKPLVFVPCL